VKSLLNCATVTTVPADKRERCLTVMRIDRKSLYLRQLLYLLKIGPQALVDIFCLGTGGKFNPQMNCALRDVGKVAKL
jgi:hypothetical protein